MANGIIPLQAAITIMRSIGEKLCTPAIVWLGEKSVEVVQEVFFSKIDDRKFIEGLISSTFINRRVMWFDMKHETISYIIDSAKELEEHLNKEIKEMPSRNDSRAVFLNSAMRIWSNEASFLHRTMSEFVENDKGEANEDKLSFSTYIKLLRDFRIKTLPVPEAILFLMPEDSPVRIDGLKLIAMAKTELKVSFDAVPEPRFEADLARLLG